MKKYLIQKNYDKKVNVFGKPKPFSNDYTELIKKNLDKNSVVLDIGCGGGRLTISINDYAKKVIGIDYSKSLLKKARRYNSRYNIEYQYMDAEHMNFKPNTFDILVSHAVINKDMCKARPTLKSAYSILKNNGKLIIKMIIKPWGKEFGFRGAYSKEEIKRILRETGFKKVITKVENQNFSSDSYEKFKWVEDTEAFVSAPKTKVKNFLEECKRKNKYVFDDSFAIIYAEKIIKK